MGRVKIEVEKAIETLCLTPEDIVLLDIDAGERLYRKLLDHFVKSGDRRWFWEDFKLDSFTFMSHERPYELLDEIMPKTKDKVWLMVEDDEETYYPIYEIKPEIIREILDQCFLFEYYIIDKRMDWLICENHHNRLIGIGEELRNINLERIDAQSTNAQHRL